MNTRVDPRELAIALLKRSQCAVQVAAVISDARGVFAWGWNSSGPDGMGQHAEAHAIARANPARLAGSTIYVAARRRKSGRCVLACPCPQCMPLVAACAFVTWRNKDGSWSTKDGKHFG